MTNLLENFSDKELEKVWIGLIFLDVTQRPDQFGGEAKFAAVNVLACTSDENDLLNKVKTRCSELNFIYTEHEDVEKLSKRLESFMPDDSLLRLIQPALDSNEIQFGTFHTCNE